MAAPGTVRQLGDAHWEVVVEREMKTPNRTGFTWQRRREKEAWIVALEAAAQRYAGVESTAGLALIKQRLSLFVPVGRKERRRVAIVREVPHVRRFIRDDDNLAFAGKQLRDAMKIVGLIYEDSRLWIDADPLPVQRVSSDGKFRVVIELQRVPPLPPSARPRKRPAPAVAGGLV